MTLSLFDQFATPYTLGIPLMLFALIIPPLFTLIRPRPLPNRTTALQSYFATTLTKQLMMPLNMPGHAWSSSLLTIMIFISLINMTGLLPYTFTPTTQLSMNMGLALPLWLATVLLGLRTQPSDTLAHMLPMGTPPPLIPILIVIETVSLFIRPLALGVRLTANLTAGHLLITLISTASLALLTMMPTIALLTTSLLILLTALEIAVAMIQAYVFTLLLSLYLQENT
uniref:ATP synthase subunit a n=2 Tax=Gekkota TaxID=8560 RepID=A0A0C4ZQ67_9SAUR|nr:ATP synthase F0 subunit 6 [Hemidactylus bowringii]AIY32701.1 ATP synthase F0 subunit 6 [Teratoscincus roborowskii]AIY61203.1 ATP synthase F0 subunit 6 [Hemidactylus bowringii]AJJ48356.1 ATP synthase F0 subunit 6 [Teratoscincus roborowskii]